MKYALSDKEFGEVLITSKTQAKRCIFRIKNGILEMTYPGINPQKKEIEEIIGRNRDELRKLFHKTPTKYLKEGEVIATHDFLITIETGNRPTFCFKSTPKILSIYCPPNTNYEDLDTQETLRRVIKYRLKVAAEIYLPQRTAQLAKETNNKPLSVGITHGRKRLGRCDSRGNILLSYYLMLLPDRLIDYIIVHELAHLHEMNHSKNFHDICNKYCEENEDKLKKELKKFPFPFD